MTTKRTYRLLAGLIVFTILLALAVSYAYVQRSNDLQHEANVQKHQTAVKSQERTAQLQFLCKKVNAVVIAASEIVNPPGSIQYPQRIRAEELLAGAHCDPKSFHLSK